MKNYVYKKTLNFMFENFEIWILRLTNEKKRKIWVKKSQKNMKKMNLSEFERNCSPEFIKNKFYEFFDVF